MSLSLVKEVAHGLKEPGIEFMTNPHLRPCVLAVWLSSFGAALHAPVTTYYYLEMGSSYTDIGVYAMIVSLGSLLTAPLQGLYADMYSPYPVFMLSVTACMVGCTVRGYGPSLEYILPGLVILSFFGGANLVAMTQAHIMKATPARSRATYVSGLLVQLGVFKLLAQLLFPLLDWILRGFGVVTPLLRKRVHMSSCMIFCVIAMMVVFRARNVLRNPPDRHDIDAEEGVDCADAHHHKHTNKTGLLASNVALHAQSIAFSALNMVWPLILNRKFGWKAVEYSYVLLLSGVISTVAVGCVPFLRRSGACFSGCILCVVAGGSGLAAVVVSPPLLHVAFYTVTVACVACLDPIIKVGASFQSVQSSQGRAFGGLVTSAELGTMLGSTVSAFLYDISSVQSGLLPMWLVVAALGIVCIALRVITYIEGTVVLSHAVTSPKAINRLQEEEGEQMWEKEQEITEER